MFVPPCDVRLIIMSCSARIGCSCNVADWIKVTSHVCILQGYHHHRGNAYYPERPRSALFTVRFINFHHIPLRVVGEWEDGSGIYYTSRWVGGKSRPFKSREWLTSNLWVSDKVCWLSPVKSRKRKLWQRDKEYKETTEAFSCFKKIPPGTGRR